MDLDIRRGCLQCYQIYSHETPFIVKEYPIPDQYIVYTELCSHTCAREYIYKRIELYKEEEKQSAYSIEYSNYLEMCTNCGNFTHPSEFCKVPLEESEAFRSYSFNGQLVKILGNVSCVFLPPSLMIEFEYLKTECHLYRMISNNIPKSKEIFFERAPIIYLQDSGADMKQFIEIEEGPIQEEDVHSHHKELITSYAIHPYNSPVNATYRELVFQVVEDMEDIFKLYLPFTILDSVCTLPIEQFNYVVAFKDYNVDMGVDFDNDFLLEEDVCEIEEEDLHVNTKKIRDKLEKERSNFKVDPLVDYSMPLLDKES